MEIFLKILYQLFTAAVLCCIGLSTYHGIFVLKNAKTKETKAQVLAFLPAFAMLLTALPAILSFLIQSKIELGTLERIFMNILEWYMMYIGPAIIIAGNIAALTFHNNLKKANISIIVLSATYAVAVQLIR